MKSFRRLGRDGLHALAQRFAIAPIPLIAKAFDGFRLAMPKIGIIEDEYATARHFCSMMSTFIKHRGRYLKTCDVINAIARQRAARAYNQVTLLV